MAEGTEDIFCLAVGIVLGVPDEGAFDGIEETVDGTIDGLALSGSPDEKEGVTVGSTEGGVECVTLGVADGNDTMACADGVVDGSDETQSKVVGVDEGLLDCTSLGMTEGSVDDGCSVGASVTGSLLGSPEGCLLGSGIVDGMAEGCSSSSCSTVVAPIIVEVTKSC